MIEDGSIELDLMARTIPILSGQVCCEGLARTLLTAALACTEADSGAALLLAGRELFAEAGACFLREQADVLVSYPPDLEFRLPAPLREKVLSCQRTIITDYSYTTSALVNPKDAWQAPRYMALLCMPIINQGRTAGILYLESEVGSASFGKQRVTAVSALASLAASSFESLRFSEALRETHMWMDKGQKIGRMGSYRWNTRTRLSWGSRECYRIFDLNPETNPIPFDAIQDRIHPDDLPCLERALAQALSTRSYFRQGYRVVHSDGTTLDVLAEGQFDIGLSGDLEMEGIITDITGRKAAEQALADARAELARAARLASLGELAGSIIHEINQPLTAIKTSAEACLRWLAKSPIQAKEARASAVRVIEEGRRATAVVEGLKTLVRDERLQLSDVDINQAVREVLLITKSELDRSGITLRTDFDEDLPEIRADRVQFQQVVLNLVRNSIDAMAGVDGRTRYLTLASKIADKHAVVTVVDNGVGFDPAHEDRLFEALFTTKEEGLGLGLTICRKTIAAHGGHLWGRPNMEHGATFTFTLPLPSSRDR